MWRKRPWRRLVTSPPTLQQKYVERGGLSFSAWFPVGVPTLGAPRPAVGGVGGLSLGRGWWGSLRLGLSTCQMSPSCLFSWQVRENVGIAKNEVKSQTPTEWAESRELNSLLCGCLSPQKRFLGLKRIWGIGLMTVFLTSSPMRLTLLSGFAYEI